MKKQAILIIVHKNTYVLEKNLQLLDSPNSDIFIHVDRKCKNFKYDFYRSLVKYSSIIYLNRRIDVRWAGFSQIQVEIALIESAMNHSEYSYLHLISGQDMIVSPIDTIVKECDKSNKIYLDSKKITNKNKWEKKVYQRISVKHIMVKYVSNHNLIKQYISRLFNRVFANIQVYCGIDLVKKNDISIRYGSNWFSIPNDCAKYILTNKKKINNYFRNGWLVDELFMQSIIAENKEFEKRLVPNKRFIKWNSKQKGHPCILKCKDLNEIKKANMFFARKFDENIDKKVIDELYKSILKEEK